jgi:putative SOS response-associated peptidase YedK
MCGRYVSVKSDEDVLRDFDAVDATGDEDYESDWNIAPTKPVRTIVNRPLRDESGSAASTPTRQLRVMSWGLVPSWAKDRGTQGKMFNARVESLVDKPAFRSAYAKRRCLVPADGWYEWQVVDGPDGPVKQPMYMTPPDGHSIAFAGVYEFWRNGDEPTLSTCAIVTAPAVAALAEIHDRMPLVLPRGHWARWLDPRVSDPSDLLAEWDEAGGEHLELRPVSTTVNSVDNNGAQLLDRVEPVPRAQMLF